MLKDKAFGSAIRRSRSSKRNFKSGNEPPSSDTRLVNDFVESIRALLSGQRMAVGLLVVCIIIGFIQGWLKLQIRHPLTTFIFDGFLFSALFVVLKEADLRHSSIQSIKPFKAFKTFLWTCVIYALVPWGPNLLISIASIRGWCFGPLSLILGYFLLSDLKKAKGFAYVVVVMAIITGVIGLGQDVDEIRQRMMQDEYFAERYRHTFYWTGHESGVELRIFSTFVSSGAFGTNMTLAGIILLGFIFPTASNNFDKTIIIIASVFFLYIIFLTGSRTSLICYVVGALIVAIKKIRIASAILLATLCFFALDMVKERTEGRVVSRFQEGITQSEVIQRNLIPLILGVGHLKDNPFGHGLGSSTRGIPFFMVQQLDQDSFRLVDGDIGRILVEFGIPGSIVLGWLLYALLSTLYRTTQLKVAAEKHAFALTVYAVFLISLISIPSGSPYLGIPEGAIIWIFAGALLAIFQDEIRNFNYSKKAFRSYR